MDSSLSPSQREVLSTIVRRGPLRLSELAAEEGLNPTMLSRIVTNLEAAKLVARRPDISLPLRPDLPCTKRYDTSVPTRSSLPSANSQPINAA
jgi:DNA-binding HxlR family transcriptional regulator